ncbi:MAG TPA: response regulator [Verrucomicrobiae bacterium]
MTEVANQGTGKPIVAVVDDDPSVLKALARLLRSAGYEVKTFVSPQEFLSSASISSARCVVVDVQMPGMSGFELQSRLKDMGRQVPIVFITAHDTPQTRVSACESGTVGLLLKPFSDDALLELLHKAVSA